MSSKWNILQILQKAEPLAKNVQEKAPLSQRFTERLFLESDDSQNGEDLLHIDTTQDDQASVNTLSSDKWLVYLKVFNHDVWFQIYTGSKCCIMVKSQLDSLDSLGKDIEMSVSHRTLRSYSNHKVKQVGTVNLPVNYKDKQTSSQFKIINLTQENIIRGDVAESIGLVQRIDAVRELSAHDELLHDFPELVKNMGTLLGEYTIKIDESYSTFRTNTIPSAWRQVKISTEKARSEIFVPDHVQHPHRKI